MYIVPVKSHRTSFVDNNERVYRLPLNLAKQIDLGDRSNNQEAMMNPCTTQILSVDRFLHPFEPNTQSMCSSFKLCVAAFSTADIVPYKHTLCAQEAFSDFLRARWFIASKLPNSSKTNVTGMFNAILTIISGFEHWNPTDSWPDAATQRETKMKLHKLIATISVSKKL
jgi:hypothetical protein